METSAKRLRTFYALILTQTLSLVGSQISGLAISIWIFNETGNVLPLAIVQAFGVLPRALMSSFAGVLADRWDRRYVMAISDGGQAIGTVILLFLFFTGGLQLWMLYLIVLFQSMIGVFQEPAFSASITMLVPDEHRDRANIIKQLTGPASGIIAPIIAGFVFALIGVNGAIMIDIVTFVIAFVVVLSVKIPHPKKSKEGAALSGTIWQELLSGYRYLQDRPVLWHLALTLLALNFLFSFSGVLFTPYILARTGSEASLGVLLGLLNAGGLVGGIAVGAWGGTKRRMYTILPGLLMMGIVAVFIGFAQSVLTLGIVFFLLLLPNPAINGMFMSITQAKVPPDLQGRVFATIGQMAMLAIPLANVLGGLAADHVFEPLVQHPQWHIVAPYFGSDAGSGMGLMFFLTGIVLTLLAIGMFAHKPFRTIEDDLPDFVPDLHEPEPALATG